MQGIVVEQFGGTERLTLRRLPAPAGGVIVQTAWAGVNFLDVHQREGRVPHLCAPFVLGIEGSGVVCAAPAESPWKPGDRVAFTTGVQGSYAEQVAVPADHLVRVPDHLSLRDACAALEHGLIANILVDRVARLDTPRAVLVHAAAGGVGRWLVQLLALGGHRLFGTASSPAKLEWLRGMGVHALHNDGSQGWCEQLAARTGGEGVHVVFDSIGQATFEGSLEALAATGHLVLFGHASGVPPPVDIERLRRKSLTLSRPVLGHFLGTAAARQLAADQVFRQVRSGAVRLHIHRTYSLAQAAHAHEALGRRATEGKLLLAVAPHLDHAHPHQEPT